MNVRIAAVTAIFSICSTAASAAPLDPITAEFLRTGTGLHLLMARSDEPMRLASDDGGSRPPQPASTPNQASLPKTRAQVKQEVLDAIADGTLPGPGENIGYPYAATRRATRQTHHRGEPFAMSPR